LPLCVEQVTEQRPDRFTRNLSVHGGSDFML